MLVFRQQGRESDVQRREKLKIRFGSCEINKKLMLTYKRRNPGKIQYALKSITGLGVNGGLSLICLSLQNNFSLISWLVSLWPWNVLFWSCGTQVTPCISCSKSQKCEFQCQGIYPLWPQPVTADTPTLLSLVCWMFPVRWTSVFHTSRLI